MIAVIDIGDNRTITYSWLLVIFYNFFPKVFVEDVLCGVVQFDPLSSSYSIPCGDVSQITKRFRPFLTFRRLFTLC